MRHIRISLADAYQDGFTASLKGLHSSDCPSFTDLPFAFRRTYKAVWLEGYEVGQGNDGLSEEAWDFMTDAEAA